MSGTKLASICPNMDFGPHRHSPRPECAGRTAAGVGQCAHPAVVRQWHLTHQNRRTQEQELPPPSQHQNRYRHNDNLNVARQRRADRSGKRLATTTKRRRNKTHTVLIDVRLQLAGLAAVVPEAAGRCGLRATRNSTSAHQHRQNTQPGTPRTEREKKRERRGGMRGERRADGVGKLAAWFVLDPVVPDSNKIMSKKEKEKKERKEDRSGRG